MIKRIQKKFIFISSLILISVFSVFFSVLNLISYITIDRKAEATIDVIIENNGTLPFLDEIPEELLSPEFLYQTRYFTVYLSDLDDAFVVNIDKIAAIDKHEAITLTEYLIKNQRHSGYLGNYRFKSKEFENGIMYVFLDCTYSLSLFKSVSASGMIISIVSVLLIFTCFILFSNKIIRPFKDNLEKQKQFITNAGHEIKTPLAIIKASTEVLEIENGKSEWTDTINEQIVKLTNLTEKLVFLSRMDENNNKLQFKTFNLSETAIEIAESFESISKTQGKPYKISVEKDVLYTGEESLIGQVISILLDNAFKYSNDGGYVDIALFKAGKDIVISVKNSVESIETKNLDKLFDRFYRSDSSRNSKTGGSGIGLSIAKAIVNSHKGKINAKSHDGKNVEFTVIL